MPLISGGAATVGVVAMLPVQEVHQWTQRKQDERQCTHQVGAVLGEKEESGHRKESGKDPR